MRSRQKALFIAELAKEKKAEDIVVLDMRKISNVTDFFIILTAASTRRAQTITETIGSGLLNIKDPLSNIEGYKEAEWIVVDAYDVVTHIFSSNLRRFYNLEGLWGDAPRVRLCQRKKKKRLKKSLKRK